MKILIIDTLHESLREGLENKGVIVHYRPEIERKDLLEIIHEYEGLVVRSKTPINKEVLEKARQLVFIGRAGSGMDNIDVETALSQKITLFNAAEGNKDAVAEHTIGLLLSLLNKIHTSYQEVQELIWDRHVNRGIEIKGKTLAIIGYGNVGEALAQKLSAFDCNIIAYDKYRKNFGTAQVKEATIETVFSEADIVSFHVPLTKETHHMLNQDYFNQFRKNILLLNTSRGKIMVQEDLIQAIRSGKVWGAGLDVLDNENIQGLSETEKKHLKTLLHFPEVLITPHVAGWTTESYRRISEVLLQKISTLIKN